MSQIDNLIFNTLADGRDLCLPEVGSLVVRRKEAVRLSARRLVPPQTDIVFSKERRGAVLTDIIASVASVSQERAEDIYRQWLQNRRREGTVAIEGVGEIGDNGFLIDEQLRNLINPMGNKEIRIRPLTNWLLISFAVLCLLFAIGVAGYIIYSERMFADKMDKASVGRPSVEQPQTPAVEPVEQTAEQETAEAVQPAEAEPPMTEPAVAEPAKAVGSQAEGVLPLSAGRSYAVWGVYIELVNAEAGLRTVNRRFSDIDARIYRYGERYMVALFDNETRSECVREVERLKERSRAFGEVWVYTARR